MHANTILPHQQSPNHPPATPEPALIRTLEQGPDYRPDWRAQTVEKYLVEIAQAEDKATKVTELAETETDEFVRQFLYFRHGLASASKPAFEYAIRCFHPPESDLTIKAMVVAGRSVEQIAAEMMTLPANIECFEKLYFDARPYLGCKLWLETICRGEGGHRWLEVALDRGGPGVEEVVLRRLERGPRNLRHAISISLGRVQDYILRQEASNVAPSEKDLELLRRMSAMLDELPFLEDPIEKKQPLPESEAFKSFYKLPAGQREKVCFFLQMLLDRGAQKFAEMERANSAKSETGENTAEPAQPEQK